MGLSFIFLALFTIFHMLRSLRNSAFSKLFLLRIIGLDIVLFVMIILAGKTETNLYLSGLSKLNKEIFILFSSIKLSSYALFRFLNLGIFLFCVSIPLVIRPHLSKKSKSRRFNWYVIPISVIVFSFLFLFLSDPKLLYLVYLEYIQGSAVYTYDLLKAINIIQKVTFFLILFPYPAAFLLFSWKRERVFIKRKQILVILYSLLSLNFFFYIFLVNRNFNIFDIVLRRSTELAHLSMTKLPGYFHTTLPLLLILSTEVFLIYLNLSQIMYPSELLQKKIIMRNSVSLRKNLGGLFHIFKNNYFSLYCLSVRLKEELPEANPTVDKLIDEIQLMQKDLNKLISSVVDIKLTVTELNPAELMDKLIAHEVLPPEIELDYRNTAPADLRVWGDEFYLLEAFTNLLKNSIEAIGTHNGNRGRIALSLSKENDFALIKFFDNGGGIPASIRHKVLQPQFSTKANRQNWGLGLTFSYRVIKMHLGFMQIVSDRGSSTEIEILLPLAKEPYHEYKDSYRR